MKQIITITTIRPFEFKQFGIKVVPGVNEIEVTGEQFESLRNIIKNNAFFKREAARKGGIKVSFKELNQEEIEKEFSGIEKELGETGKHSDLAALGIEELRKIFTELTGEGPGQKQAPTLRKAIVKARESEEVGKVDVGNVIPETEGQADVNTGNKDE